MIKAGDFPHRLGDQSAKTQGSNGTTGNQHNSVRTGQQSMGFRKSLDSQNVLVGNQPVSPLNSGTG